MHHNRQRTLANLYTKQRSAAARHSVGQFATSTLRARLLLTMTKTPSRSIFYDGLLQAGYDVQLASSEGEMFAQLEQVAFDLILLHTELPETDVFHLCTIVRDASSIPIILVAEQKNYSDMIHGLALGADEYVAMPMTLAELDARLGAALRRAGYKKYLYRSSGSPSASIILNDYKRTVQVRNQEIQLTQIEFRILNHLLHHANTPVAKDKLIQAVWGFAESEEFNFIEVAIRRLRQKLEAEPSKPEYLITVRGAGYQLNVG